jgi:hypothetical protein
MLAAQHVSTVLTMADSAEMMIGLKALLGVTMTFDGHVVTLHARRTGAPVPKHRQEMENPSLEVGR